MDDGVHSGGRFLHRRQIPDVGDEVLLPFLEPVDIHQIAETQAIVQPKSGTQGLADVTRRAGDEEVVEFAHLELSCRPQRPASLNLLRLGHVEIGGYVAER